MLRHCRGKNAGASTLLTDQAHDDGAAGAELHNAPRTHAGDLHRANVLQITAKRI
jgi:hypothetical protein